MPIEVHCPNPDCAKVHQVKNKYAGSRGKCPACKSWMYIPKTGVIASVPDLDLSAEKAPEADVWSARTEDVPRGRAARKLAESRPVLQEEPIEEIPLVAEEPEPRRKRRASEDEEELVADVEVLEEEPASPRRHFSIIAIFLLLLGNLGLVLFAVAPYLSSPEVTTSDPNLTRSLFPSPINPELVFQVSGAAGVVGVFGLLAFLLSLRKIDMVGLFMLYVAVLGSSVLLMVSLTWLTTELNKAAKVEDLIQKRNATGSVNMREQHYALAGGAAAAAGFFVLSGLFMHRRIWSRLLGFLFLSLWPALAVAWVYRRELGIAEMVPFEIPGL